MVLYAKLGKSCGEVYGIARKEVSMNAIQRTINLWAGQHVEYLSTEGYALET